MRFFSGRSLFTSLFAPSRSDDYLARYVLREHARGRALADVLDDPYVRNRSTPEQRVRLAVLTPGQLLDLGLGNLLHHRSTSVSPGFWPSWIWPSWIWPPRIWLSAAMGIASHVGRLRAS